MNQFWLNDILVKSDFVKTDIGLLYLIEKK